MKMIRSVRAAFVTAVFALPGVAAAEFPRWSQTPSVLEGAFAVTMGGSDPSILLARRAQPNRLAQVDPARSEDGGKTWTGFTVLGTRPDRFISAPTNAQVLYALTGGVAIFGAAPTTASSFYRTSDAGRTWELLAASFVSSNGALLGNISVGANADLVYALRMVPSSCSIGCSHEGNEAFLSSDGGRSWRSIDGGLGLNELYPSASDARVVYGKASYRGIYRSDDQGSSWKLVRTWDTYTYPRQVLVDSRDPLTVYVRPNDGTGLWVTEDGGTTWRTSPAVNVPGPTKWLVADPLISGRIFFMGYEGEVFESRDRARTWKRVVPSSGARLVGLAREYWDSKPAVGTRGDTRVVVASSGVPPGVQAVELGEQAVSLGSDLWWNPAEAGAGFTITQHASGQVFAVWYSYDAAGLPAWYTIPGGSWTDSRTFTGTIYRTHGPAYFKDPFDPARVSVAAVGTANLAFGDDSHAAFSYRFDDGTQGEKQITREVFVQPDAWNIENYSDLWWNAAESGWGLTVTQQWGRVFATWFVYDDAGRPLWIVLPDSSYRSATVSAYGRHGWQGDIYTTTGPPSGAAFDPRKVVATNVGTAWLVFDGRDRALLTYTAFGKTETRELTRQPF